MNNKLTPEQILFDMYDYVRSFEVGIVTMELENRYPEGFSFIDEDGNERIDVSRPIITVNLNSWNGHPYDFFVNKVYKKDDMWFIDIEEVEYDNFETILLSSNEIEIGHLVYIIYNLLP